MRTILTIAALLAALLPLATAQTSVVNSAGPGPAEFGAATLRTATGGKRLGSVRLAVSSQLKPEAFRIAKVAGGYEVLGGDARGAMYGALDFAEQVELTGAVREKRVEPALAMRALKFNIPLPGTGYLSEEDLANNAWFWRLDYWQRFLDMAARNRYNTLSFWSAHPFDRMVRIARYPEAAAVTDAELDRNIAFFRKLFQMAADRGLDTYMVTWNIHVPRAFAGKRNIPSSGFDSPEVRDYQREAIKALFATYPMLTGLGTTLGERMPNMTARQKLDWVADTYFVALREMGRTVPFILRYWQSEPQPLADMLAAVKYPGPVYLDIKYNGEHMYSSTQPHVQDKKWMELARGRYRLLWHLRNDDLFILRWGDPEFVRETVRNMAGPDSAGFVEGSEIDVPGTDRIHTPAAKAHVDWEYKFDKHWFRYMLWGRLGFDAREPDETWIAHFRHRFGAAGADVFQALTQASKIAPLITSYHWNYMNGDWYPEGSIGSWNTSYEQPRVNYRRATMYHDIRTYIFNNTIDSSMANIPEFLAGSKATGPLVVADRLESYGRSALQLAGQARSRVKSGQKEFACTDADLQAYGNLGIYYAEKLRGATQLARFLFNGGTGERDQSVEHLRKAAAAWRGVVASTENHYIPHEVWLFGQFDWKRYLPAVEEDIQIAREAKPFPTDSTYGLEGMHQWLQYSSELLGRRVAAKPPAYVAPVRIEAEAADSMSPRMSTGGGSQASGGRYYITLSGPAEARPANAITGARDTISQANSATYRIQVPAGGAYQVWLSRWWEDRSDNLALLVDESHVRIYNMRPDPDARLRSWDLQKLDGTLNLGAGSHTIRIFARTPGARVDRLIIAPPLTDPASVPDWARSGLYRSARWDGGPIEAEKGRLSDWPNYTSADEHGVMAATREWYNPRTIDFLKTAHINWAWVTWSVGFSNETEQPQWEQLRRYIEECHRNGIRVAAYFSIANMFWEDMFDKVPASRQWVDKMPDGSPRYYKPPHRYMARIDHPGWREYVRARIRAALDAGADSFWVDNTGPFHKAPDVQLLLEEVYAEAVARGRSTVLMSNYNSSVYKWARFQNGVTTEDGREPGYWPEDPEPRRLVTNAGLLRYQYGLSEGWRPVSVEYGGRHTGERFTTPMEPSKWQLSVAECAAFQASLEPFFEGQFLRDLHFGVPAAMEKLKAIGKYNKFLEEHEAYYRDTESAATLAVLAGGDDRVVSSLNALAARNVQFDVVFPGDDVKRYRTVVPASQVSNLSAEAAAGPVTVDAPPAVLYNVLRRRGSGELLVHLLNYTQKPLKGIRVRVNEAVGRVTLLSPDFDGARDLRVSGNAFEVPELNTYDLLVIGARR